MPEILRRNLPFGGEAIGIIPARRASTRFPDKPLALIHKIPMICWTWRNANRATALKEVIVAAEDEEIVEAVHEYGGKALLIRGEYASGSDRVAAVMKDLPAPAIVNIQADEPLVDPAMIDKALELLDSHPEFGMTTVVAPLMDDSEFINPNCVKVIVDRNYRCLYFSRSPIPYLRKQEKLSGDSPVFQHIGLYCFRRTALDQFAKLPSSRLEVCEGLEQLRYLEHGGTIGAVISLRTAPGVNTKEDLIRLGKYITRYKISFDTIP